MTSLVMWVDDGGWFSVVQTATSLWFCQRYLCDWCIDVHYVLNASENTRREGWHVWANVIATLYTPHQNIEQTDTVTADYSKIMGGRGGHQSIYLYFTLLHSSTAVSTEHCSLLMFTVCRVSGEHPLLNFQIVQQWYSVVFCCHQAGLVTMETKDKRRRCISDVRWQMTGSRWPDPSSCHLSRFLTRDTAPGKFPTTVFPPSSSPWRSSFTNF